MTQANVLLIESERTNNRSFAGALKRKGYSVAVENKVDGAIKRVQRRCPDVVILDAASMRTTGTRMCRKLRQRLNGTPLILIAPEGTEFGNGESHRLTLIQPFTPRKLLNQVARLIPGDARDEISAGPIRLNLAQRRVSCMGRESHLTPRLVHLLRLMIERKGRLLTREFLMKKVWYTDYIGDTRTIDVHMSWLRKAVEPDPQNPRFIKTIRGLGYRLDLPRE